MAIRLVIISFLMLSGCLRTREDLKEIEETNAMRDQVTTLQKTHADASTRLEELLEQNRSLNGRLGELEHKLQKSEQDSGLNKESSQKSLEELRRNNDLMQESIAKIESQLQGLQEEIVSLRTKEGSKAIKGDNAKEKDRDKEVIESALAHFEGKKWREAILNFDQYREKNPKGKFAAEATYKTGVCFQELGMSEEAKVFFQEVLAKYPQSDMAKKAQYRLKSIK